MARFLKQSTAATVTVGPFIDEVDFITPITSLTHAGITAGVIKGAANSAITVTASAGDNDLVHIVSGLHSLELTSADTDTLGHLRVHLLDADSFLPIYEDFEVLAANVYDSLVGGGDALDVQVAGMDADTVTAAAVAAGAIDAATFAPGAIDAAAIATDAIDADALSADSAVGSVAGAVGSVTGSVGSVSGSVGSLGAQAKLDAKAEADAALTDYAGPTTAEMDSAHALLATPAQVATEILDALRNDTMAELSALPAVDASIADKISLVFELMRNKLTNDGSVQTLYKDDGGTTLGTQAITKAAGVVTRAKYA